jgi:hypothetical protein
LRTPWRDGVRAAGPNRLVGLMRGASRTPLAVRKATSNAAGGDAGAFEMHRNYGAEHSVPDQRKEIVALEMGSAPEELQLDHAGDTPDRSSQPGHQIRSGRCCTAGSEDVVDD